MTNWGQTTSEAFNGAMLNSQKLAFEKWQQQQNFGIQQQELAIKQRESNTNNAMMMLWMKNQGIDPSVLMGGQGGSPMPQSSAPNAQMQNQFPANAMMSLKQGGMGDINANPVTMPQVQMPQQSQIPSGSGSMFANMQPSITGGKFSLKTPMFNMAPQDLQSNAQMLLNGTMVPSQINARQRGQVLAAAQQLDPTYNPAQADINFAADKAGANGMEKLYNNVKTFHDTFRKNADLALSLSDKFDRSQVPALNEAIIKGQNSISGNPEASRMLTAINTVAAEYARLTNSPGASGSVISDSARHEAQGLLSAWMNQGQIRGLLDPESGVMSLDANNRLQALEDRRSATRGNNSTSQSTNTSSKNKIGKYSFQ